MRPPAAQPELPAERQRPSLTARIVALAALAVAAGLLLAPIPPGWLGVWQGRILDFGHVPLFAALVLAFRFGTGATLLRSLCVTVALAGLTEIVQPFVGRAGEWVDFVRSALGALSAAAAVRAWEARRSRGWATVYLALAVALPVWPVVEIAPYLADTVDGCRAFPVIADFATDHELLRWESEQVTIARADPGCRIDFLPGPGEYSGAVLRPVVGNFGGYRWLCYEFQVIDAPLELATSIRTGLDGSGHTTHTDVAERHDPGHHVARLDLAALAARGRPVRLDLSDVRSMILFMVRPQERHTIILRRVWLER